MSSDEILTDRDRQVFEAARATTSRRESDATDDQPEDGEKDTAQSCTDCQNLREENAELKARVRRLEVQLEAVIDRVDTLENGTPAEDDVEPIVHYARIPADERADKLSMSDQIAALLHEQWDDIAWALGHWEQRRYGVDTQTKANAKHNPSKLKRELTRRLDKSLQATQVYRGLQQLAKLSGGEERTDVSGRIHISGGIYEYREMTTADNQTVKRVVWKEKS